MARGKLILGKYQAIGQIGKGGFAKVVLAWDPGTQRKVAIKCINLASGAAASRVAGRVSSNAAATTVLQPVGQGAAVSGAAGAAPPVGVGGAPQAKAAPAATSAQTAPQAKAATAPETPGLAEARAVARFSDPNIVTVHSFDVEGDTAYLVMEYVEGATLAQLLEEHNDDITLNVVAAVFSSVAHALEVAHAEGVLHLDIKPANVLIDRKGQVKVADFGLAALVEAEGAPQANGGTIGYMPLEQMEGAPLDARCDEWALASLTYEMLLGENPFSAPNLRSAKAAIENAELTLPSLCWEEADDELDDVIFRALDPDPNERYDTVRDFDEELIPCLGDPKRGKKELANLVCGVMGDEDAAGGAQAGGAGAKAVGTAGLHATGSGEELTPRTPLMQRIGPRAMKVIARIFCVPAAFLVGLVALANFPLLVAEGMESPILWGVLAAVVVLTAVLPHAGALAAFVLLGVSLVANGAYAPGILLVAGACAWWWFAARGNSASAVSVLAQPLFGAVGFAPVAPVLAGGLVPSALRAAVSAAFAGLAAVALGSLGSCDMIDWNAFLNWNFATDGSLQAAGNAVTAASSAAAGDVPSTIDAAGSAVDAVKGTFLDSTSVGGQTQARLGGMLSKASTWFIWASWVGAAAAASAVSNHATSRKLDVLAAVVAALILVAGLFAGAWLSQPGSWMMPSAPALAATLAAGALGVALAVLGLPDKVRQ